MSQEQQPPADYEDDDNDYMEQSPEFPQFEPYSTKVKVSRASLRNAVNNGLRRRSFWQKLSHFCRPRVSVNVEAQPDGRYDSIFYAPITDYKDTLDSPSNIESTGNNNEEGDENGSNNGSQSIQQNQLANSARRSDSGSARRMGSFNARGGRRRPQNPPTETEFVTVDPSAEDIPYLCHSSDDIEISFAGMCVPPSDTFPNNGNELILYSLRSHMYQDQESDGEDNEDHGFQPASFGPRRQSETLYEHAVQNDSGNIGRSSSTPLSVADSNGINLSPTDYPIIHYDPVTDGNNQPTIPDSFIPIPASKAMYRQHLSSKINVSSLPLRFTVMEIDKFSGVQANALRQVDSIEGFASNMGAPVPYSGVITNAVSVLKNFGRNGLKRYIRPDHIISYDFKFSLFDPTSTQPQQYQPTTIQRHKFSCSYLRYGYYFFLQKPVDAKLYAQTDTSSRNVQLLLKRTNFESIVRKRPTDAVRRYQGKDSDIKEYFPLTGVAYVVIKVSPCLSKTYRERTRAMAMENRARLEHILNISNALEMLADLTN